MNKILTAIHDFLVSAKRPLLVLLGPTASGKTALSIDIAKRYNGEIISADSRQVYRFMDIGTDKIPMGKREGIPHHLIDVVNPDERFTVADFKRLTDAAIEAIWKRGKIPFLVGGTGLYLRAVTENFLIPPENPAVRARLESELKENGAVTLYGRLKELDPEAAKKIHPNNIPYLIRALEIVEVTGKPKSGQKGEAMYDCLKLGITRPREILFERIEKRIDEQVEKNGLIEETRMLLDRGYAPALASMQSLGYKELVEYIKGRLTLPQAIELLKKKHTQFRKTSNHLVEK